jgi:cytochrome c biogenesis protein CcmG/thiol:disulfide interchange protein DsbE
MLPQDPMSEPRTTTRSRFVFLATLVVACSMIASLWQAIDARGPMARARGLMPSIGAQKVERPLPSAVAEMKLELPGGGVIRLADLPPDRLVFLNLWATWCEPCVREIPSMLQLSREIRHPRFSMVAVSYDEDWKTVVDFFRGFLGGLPKELTLARDPIGENPGSLRLALGTEKLPETWVIRGGQILSRFVNERDWMDPAIVEYFERLLEAR